MVLLGQYARLTQQDYQPTAETREEAKDESRWPRTCDMHQGESLCPLSTCCDRVYVLTGP